MNIKGVNGNHDPFLYLDSYMPNIDWATLHSEVSFGVAKSKWLKRAVSAGVHDEWKHLELATYFKNPELYLDQLQLELFHKLETTDQKMKFLACVTPCLHPFWIILLRSNQIKEISGIENKSVAEECRWTEHAQNFPSVVKLIEQLPLKSVGRVIMFLTEPKNDLVPHYDAMNQQQRDSKGADDFIYFTTDPNGKRLFVMDGVTLEKAFPEPGKHFIWWNEMDFHGTDAAPKFSFSIRVEGKFKDGIK